MQRVASFGVATAAALAGEAQHSCNLPIETVSDLAEILAKSTRSWTGSAIKMK